jgi:hypothetical protein
MINIENLDDFVGTKLILEKYEIECTKAGKSFEEENPHGDHFYFCYLLPKSNGWKYLFLRIIEVKIGITDNYGFMNNFTDDIKILSVDKLTDFEEIKDNLQAYLNNNTTEIINILFSE